MAQLKSDDPDLFKSALTAGRNKKWTINIEEEKVFDIRTYSNSLIGKEDHNLLCKPKYNSNVRANILEFKSMYSQNPSISAAKQVDHFLSRKVKLFGLDHKDKILRT